MNYNYYRRPNHNNGDRQFVFPFLVGALTGGAAVGLTRPRPIYNVGGYYPMPYGPYGYSSYGYYFPR